ncbi:MAG: hypothetical protein NT038_11200 [Euryarchaeota archaeon]|nr:hypothetical protein [Euryarchaeota archaeon]
MGKFMNEVPEILKQLRQDELKTTIGGIMNRKPGCGKEDLE